MSTAFNLHAQCLICEPVLLFLNKCYVFYQYLVVHMTSAFMSRPKDQAITVKCIAKGHMCQDLDSNQYSADQKHKSLKIQCSKLLDHDTFEHWLKSHVITDMNYILSLTYKYM